MREQLRNLCLMRFKPLLEIVAPGWIAGGAVRDFFSQQPTDSDIDVFFADVEGFAKAQATMVATDGAVRIYENPAMDAFRWRGKTVQLIRQHFFPTPQDTIAAFDFTVCCCAVDLNDVVVHEHFFDDLAGRRLAINRLPFPMSTLERLQKYVAKGYRACNGTLLELAKGIQDTNLGEPSANTLSFYPDGTPRFARFD